MDDKNKPEENHLEELMELHNRIIELDKLEIERKQAEDKLREIEDKIHKVFDKAEGVITIIQDRLIKYVNHSIEELIGYTPEEIIGTSFENYIHPDVLPELNSLYLKRIAGEDIPNVYTTVIKHKDGSDVHIEIKASAVKYQGRLADLAIVKRGIG